MHRNPKQQKKKFAAWLAILAILLAVVPIPHQHHEHSHEHHEHHDEATHTQDVCHNIVFHGAKNQDECPHPAHLSNDKHECEICAHFSAQKNWIGIAIKSNFENSFLAEQPNEASIKFASSEKHTLFLRGPPALV